MPSFASPQALLDWSREEASRWLDVPEFRDRRWRHVQAVGAKAELLAPAFRDGAILSASAWLHDIGYASPLIDTGFHPIDGARCLERQGLGMGRVAALVANHSGASTEAELRDLNAEMLPYPDEKSEIRDALWTCDMTTSPVGEPVTFDERLAEITKRYGSKHTVPRAITAAGDEIRASILRTKQKAREAGITISGIFS